MDTEDTVDYSPRKNSPSLFSEDKCFLKMLDLSSSFLHRHHHPVSAVIKTKPFEIP